MTVAQIEFLNETEAALRPLATDEIYKGKGYATTMMTYLEKWLRKNGKKVIKFHAALSAEGFYRKLGYTEMPFDDPCIFEDIINLGKIL